MILCVSGASDQARTGWETRLVSTRAHERGVGAATRLVGGGKVGGDCALGMKAHKVCGSEWNREIVRGKLVYVRVKARASSGATFESVSGRAAPR